MVLFVCGYFVTTAGGGTICDVLIICELLHLVVLLLLVYLLFCSLVFVVVLLVLVYLLFYDLMFVVVLFVAILLFCEW